MEASLDILVINCGSSSLKADVLDADTGTRHAWLRVERIGGAGCQATLSGGEPRPLDAADHGVALAALLDELLDGTSMVAAVGHRVVHGGERFDQPVRIDASVEEGIEALSRLAPLHNPANLSGIRAARRLLPDVPHIAVFDTAFHATLPRRARSYALPGELVERHGLRRYGFHGPSHAWVAQRAANFMESDLRDLRIITCHLGNGASVCAVEYGRSVETSMGMTPLEGLVMGTRSGDVDAGLLLELARREGLSLDALDKLLNEQSGLAGLSGVGNDLRDIEERAAEGDERCRLALHVFAHRLRKYIGAYAAVMGGVDAIVFTGGIGQNSALIRHRAAQRLEFLGARLGEDRNRDARVSADVPVAEISSPRSRTILLVVQTDEEHAIAQAAGRLVREQDGVSGDLRIPVAVSARHIHLTQEAVEALFGEGHQLTRYRDISQPGQYACAEKVDIIGPRRTIEGVRILGPIRPACQVEVSRTDEFALGIDAPIRDSGDVRSSPGVTLQGPAGRLTLQEGVICARRHIHMTPEDAERFGVKDRDVVEVEMDSEGRNLTFGDVLIRVSPRYKLEMHIDTDEANAAEIRPGAQGSLASTPRTAHLLRRNTRYDR
ncbi:MAG: acetate kinase [Myxococcota bacterium]|jgi:acetate kinase